MTPEQKLQQMGLVLPPPVKAPAGVHIPFVPVNVRGDRAVFSGHPRHGADGVIDGPYGLLGANLSTAEGHAAAQAIALSVLANIKAEIGELSRIKAWVRVFGMVASVPGYTEQHLVLNGFSDLITQVFGTDVARHARSAIGVPSLPLNFAIEIEGEVLIDD